MSDQVPSSNNQREFAKSIATEIASKLNTGAEDTTLLKAIAQSLKSLPDSFKKIIEQQTVDTKPKSELEQIDKPKEVVIGGLTTKGIKEFGFSDIVKDSFAKLEKSIGKIGTGFKEFGDKLSKQGDEEGLLSKFIPKGAWTAIAGFGVLLAGVTAIVEAFKTNGPEKGALELIGKGGVKGGLAILAKTVFKTITKSILKRIPIIGSLLSFGFAFQRFSNGDTIGGIIELVSGTVGLLDFVIPGLGSALSLGVDVFQSFLDAKSGGSSPEANKKKGNILTQWGKDLLESLKGKIEYIPVLGALYTTGKAFADGDAKKAVTGLISLFPEIAWVKDLINVGTTKIISVGKVIGESRIVTSLKEFLKPAMTLFKSIKDTLFSIPGKIIDRFKDIFGGVSKLGAAEEIVGDATKAEAKAGSKIFGSLKKFKDNLFSIPEKIIDKFKGIFGAMFTSGAAKEVVADVIKVEGKVGVKLLPKLLGGVTKALKVLPFIGSLLSIADLAKRFKDGDNVGLGIQLLSIISGVFLPGSGISLALDTLNMVLDYKTQDKTGKEGSNAKLDLMSKWVEDLGGWLKKKIMSIPYVKELINGFEAFNTNPIGMLRAFQSAHPICGMIADFFEGDLPKTNTPRSAGNIAGVYVDRLKTWLMEKIEKIPYIGPMLASNIREIADNPLELLEIMAGVFPGGTAMVKFLKDLKPLTAEDGSFTFKDPFEAMTKMIVDKTKSWWANSSKWIRAIASEMLPDSMVKELNEGMAEQLSLTEEANKRLEENKQAQQYKPNETPEAKKEKRIRSSNQGVDDSKPLIQGRLQDGMLDPNGGLVVSSPKIGAMWQLHKQDGIVAGPMARGAYAENSSNRSDSILERIANNTGGTTQNISNLINGFNNLARALEKTLGESAKIPVVINNTSNQGPIPPTDSHYANAGNSSISNFRSSTVEGGRARPA